MDFAALKSKVAGYLNRDDLTAIIPDFINSAMHRVERESNFKGMEKKATGTTTNDYIAIPSDYKETKSLFITASGKQTLLKKDSYSHMITSYPYGSSSTGTPEVFAAVKADDKFYLRPYPDAAETYEIVYFAHTSDLSLDADTNDWTINAWEVLLYGALLEASPYMADDERIVIWQGFYDRAVKGILDAENKEKTAGSPQKVTSDYVV